MCVSVAAASMRAMLLTKLISGLTQKKKEKRVYKKLQKSIPPRTFSLKKEYRALLFCLITSYYLPAGAHFSQKKEKKYICLLLYHLPVRCLKKNPKKNCFA
jgi:hypothetical protein